MLHTSLFSFGLFGFNELDVETAPCSSSSIVVVVIAEGRSVGLVNKRPVSLMCSGVL
jgi:hypothetical protein